MRVLTIDIGGQERSFSFGLEVIGWLQVDTGLDITDLGGITETSMFLIMLPSLLYRSHLQEVKNSGKLPNFTKADVDKWLTDKGMHHKDILAVWKTFMETVRDYTPKSENDEQAPAGEKKS